MSEEKADAFVFFGATGDLAYKQIFPALLALVRELKEEIGIDTAASCLAPIAFASHGYESFHLLMPVFACRKWNGIARPREGQTLKWVAPRELGRFPMPPADLPLVAMLRDLL